ncbi:MAG: [protein-PII] uridylyltransferase [Pseudomonadales bacterium]
MAASDALKTLQEKVFSLTQFQALCEQSGLKLDVYRQALAEARKALSAQFVAGADVRHLVHTQAWLIDQLLITAWNNFDWKDADNISLVAVGGYGRGELHPYSDIDLLILLAENCQLQHQDNIERFITFLWDIGLKVGNSVRTVRECHEQAQLDITVATSLMESRLLVGSRQLLEAMDAAISPAQIWPPQAFFEAKREEQRARHEKFNDTDYNLEPNVKESPGGLRDIQVINWVAKRHFDSDNLHDLVSNGFLSETEFKLLSECQEYLWKIRYGLHMFADRAEDRLLFDYQKQLASLFGFKDNDEELAIEQLMQEFYRVVIRTLGLNDMLLQHFDEAILRANEEPVVRQLNTRFKVTNDYIEVTHPGVFRETPSAMLEIFVLMAKHPDIQGVRATTIRLILDHRYLIDEAFRSEPKNIELFMALLRSPSGVCTQLQRMRRYGVLGLYLPEFGQITGKMQHDLYHIYTVDAHTMLLLQYLRRMWLGNKELELPVATQVSQQIPHMELLYIAGLYHDIAKGRGGSHALLGAVDARQFCERHQLEPWACDLVSWLVENHLFMSMIAQRRDITDPEVVQNFAEKMQDQLHLDYLFLLTVADINATNPTLWNSWRAQLLRQLYIATKRALSRGLDNPIKRESAIAQKKEQALALLPFNPSIISLLWRPLAGDYFIQHEAEDIAWHTQAILEHRDPNTPLVMFKEMSDQHNVGGTQIFVYAHTKHHLFATTAAVLEQLNLNILDARITKTKDDFNLNTYMVLEEDGHPLSNDPERLEEVRNHLVNALRQPQNPPSIPRRHTPRWLKHFTIPTQVSISDDEVQGYTVVEVITPDRPGLLARIGRIFLKHGVELQKAKIATLGERVEDVFFITTKDLKPLADSKLQEALKAEICTQLDESAQFAPDQKPASSIAI